MKKILYSLILASLFLVSCRSNNVPTGAGNGPLITAYITGQDVRVAITDAQQIPVTTAAVTFSCSAAPSIPMTFAYITNDDVTLDYSAGLLLDTNVGLYGPSLPLTFTPGQPVSLTVAYGGRTYTSVIQSPVGAISLTPSSSGVSAVWVGGDNASQAWDENTLSPLTSTLYTGSLSSPYFMPASYAAGDNSYTVSLVNVSGFTGGAAFHSNFASLSSATTTY